jgi:hypothetical protein
VTRVGGPVYSDPKYYQAMARPNSGWNLKSGWRRAIIIRENSCARLQHSSRITKLSSSGPGKSISEVEVTNISAHGLWLLVRDRELFLSYEDFPWFKDQPVKSIVKLEEQSPGHFYWPDIDVDLTEEMIEHPDRFPLTAKTG